jgi:hypothetical protein
MIGLKHYTELGTGNFPTVTAVSNPGAYNALAVSEIEPACCECVNDLRLWHAFRSYVMRRAFIIAAAIAVVISFRRLRLKIHRIVRRRLLRTARLFRKARVAHSPIMVGNLGASAGAGNIRAARSTKSPCAASLPNFPVALSARSLRSSQISRRRLGKAYD